MEPPKRMTLAERWRSEQAPREGTLSAKALAGSRYVTVLASCTALFPGFDPGPALSCSFGNLRLGCCRHDTTFGGGSLSGLRAVARSNSCPPCSRGSADSGASGGRELSLLRTLATRSALAPDQCLNRLDGRIKTVAFGA